MAVSLVLFQRFVHSASGTYLLTRDGGRWTIAWRFFTYSYYCPAPHSAHPRRDIRAIPRRPPSARHADSPGHVQKREELELRRPTPVVPRLPSAPTPGDAARRKGGHGASAAAGASADRRACTGATGAGHSTGGRRHPSPEQDEANARSRTRTKTRMVHLMDEGAGRGFRRLVLARQSPRCVSAAFAIPRALLLVELGARLRLARRMPHEPRARCQPAPRSRRSSRGPPARSDRSGRRGWCPRCAPRRGPAGRPGASTRERLSGPAFRTSLP